MSVTISDIAKKAGVSPATVSRVLNDSGYVKQSTRIKVESIIKEMNFIPSAIARSLSTSETNTVGVIVPDITNSYFGKVIKGISEIAEENKLNIILFNSDNLLSKEVRALKVLKEQRIRGIIMTPGFGEEKNNKEYIETIKKMNIPIVLVSADLKFEKLSGVFVDNVMGGFLAAKKLIDEGHQKIAIITGIMESEPATERLVGYKKAMNDAGLEINKDYILNGNFDMNTAYKLTSKLINGNNPPTAIIACSNRMTVGVIQALKDNNLRIEKDVSIIAFDKIDLFDILGIDITYIDECPEELGKKSMRLLIKVFENKINKETRIVVKPKMIKAKLKKDFTYN